MVVVEETFPMGLVALHCTSRGPSNVMFSTTRTTVTSLAVDSQYPLKLSPWNTEEIKNDCVMQYEINYFQELQQQQKMMYS